MSYNPINLSIYLAAYQGAQAGMGASGRLITDGGATPSGTDPVAENTAIVANAYAQEFDTLFAESGLPVDSYSASAADDLSAAIFWERNPIQATPPQANVSSPATYSQPILGILALISAAELQFAVLGIVPPPLPLNATGAAPGTPAYNPAWYAMTDIYIDPVNGHDGNAGTITAPIQHFSEAVRRYGAIDPQMNYGQNVTFHFLNSQPAGTDPIFFYPQLSGGGYCALIGTLIVAQAAFVAGVTTQPVVAAAGSLLTIAAVPAGVVAGVLLNNTTRNGWAFVDSVAAGTASVQQPMTNASITTIGTGAGSAQNTWATVDTIVGYTTPTINLKAWDPAGSDESSGGAVGCGWVQWITIADPSGTGASAYRHHNRAASNVLSACRINARLDTSSEAGRGASTSVLACTMMGGGNAHYGGSTIVYGGGFLNGNTIFGAGWEQELNTVFHGTLSIEATDSELDGFYSDGTVRIAAFGSAQWVAAAWGTFLTNVQQGSLLVNNSGTTWVLGWLTSGAMTMGTVGTASTYSGLGVWADGVAITQANIDAGGGAGRPGMRNVVTGSAYCDIN
jgi:hypothetical protein